MYIFWIILATIFLISWFFSRFVFKSIKNPWIDFLIAVFVTSICGYLLYTSFFNKNIAPRSAFAQIKKTTTQIAKTASNVAKTIQTNTVQTYDDFLVKSKEQIKKTNEFLNTFKTTASKTTNAIDTIQETPKKISEQISQTQTQIKETLNPKTEEIKNNILPKITQIQEQTKIALQNIKLPEINSPAKQTENIPSPASSKDIPTTTIKKIAPTTTKKSNSLLDIFPKFKVSIFPNKAKTNVQVNDSLKTGNDWFASIGSLSSMANGQILFTGIISLILIIIFFIFKRKRK